MIDLTHGRVVSADAAQLKAFPKNGPVQSAGNGLAAPDAADREIRELDWASPKRPGRGVPPPRPGLGVT
jgi:hypothetical protein